MESMKGHMESEDEDHWTEWLEKAAQETVLGWERKFGLWPRE
jgi:hypothetical protein